MGTAVSFLCKLVSIVARAKRDIGVPQAMMLQLVTALGALSGTCTALLADSVGEATGEGCCCCVTS